MINHFFANTACFLTYFSSNLILLPWIFNRKLIYNKKNYYIRNKNKYSYYNNNLMSK